MAGLGPDTVLAWAGLAIVVAMATFLGARVFALRSSPPFPGEPTFYQAALMAGGRRRVVETALGFLVWAGVLEVRERTGCLVLRALPPPGARLEPVERALVNSVTAEGTPLSMPLAAASLAAAEMERRMEGLMPPPWLTAVVRFTTLVVLGVTVVVAGWWMEQRLAAGLDIGLVPLVALAGFGMGWWVLVAPSPVTGTGRASLERLRRRHDPDLEIASIGVTSLPLERAMYVVALYGRDALTGGLGSLRRVLVG